MNRKICVVTGTRAEYGLLRWVMNGIENSTELTLQVIATGMHLSPEFGLTYSEIEKDGLRIDRKIEMLLSSDTSTGLAKSMGIGMIGFADALGSLKPDLLVVLGDRFEIFSAVAVAMTARIPVAHIHGGEITEGVIDEAIRHSVTKMSHLHFVATQEYYHRVIQLGEQPERVFHVGGLGIDNINNLKLIYRNELELLMNFKFGVKNLLVTFHPVTLERSTAGTQMSELLSALEELEETSIIFTMPNADTDGRALFPMINDFVSRHDNCKAYTSLGHLKYLSCMRYVDGVVGNSSSGLIEAPTFKKGTINIGDRQRGRLKADSVIDCEPNKNDILLAIDQLYSSNFKKILDNVENPYGVGGASEKIVEIIQELSYDDFLKKRFNDQL